MKMKKKPQNSAYSLMRKAAGFQTSFVLLVSNEVGILQTLSGESTTANALARRLKLNAEAVDLVLNALAGAGILMKNKELYSMPRTIQPFFSRDSYTYIGDILHYFYNDLKPWMQLEQVLRNGRYAGEHESEKLRDAAQIKAFVKGMANITRLEIRNVLKIIDPSNYRMMLDLGGSPGTAAVEFCRRNRTMKAVVFDRPEVLPFAVREIKKADLADRISTMPGDFNRQLSLRGFDLIYAANVIHAYSLDEIRNLFQRCYGALSAGGTIVIKDFLLNEDATKPVANSLFAINMLVNTPGGRSYTIDEVKTALKKTGFHTKHFAWVSPNSALLSAQK